MEETSSRLVRGIADFQDHQSWFEFDHRYRLMIRNVLRKKGLREADLDDAVQDTYLSLLATIGRFRYDRSRGKFRSWISKISQRAAGAQRRRKPLPSEPGDPDVPTADDPLARLSDPRVTLCLDLARARFDESTWLPFYLRVIEEAPIEEVQRITGMNRNAIYQAVHRVKSCLRDMLQQLDPSPTSS